jgi:Helix-turn-helix domain
MHDHCEGDLVTTGGVGKQEVQVVESTLKKGTRVTGVDRSKLATLLGKRYDNGESIRSLAASTGRSYGFVHRILTETGVTLRGRGGATRSKAKV